MLDTLHHGHHMPSSGQPIIFIFLPFFMCFMRLAPAVMEFGHTRNCSESLTRLSLQLLAVVGGVVGQRDGEGGRVVLLGPEGCSM